MQCDGGPIIEVRGLVKRLGEVSAVAGIEFDVRGGEVFGFLGPNGAGKTTTINLLTGLARPDAGTMRIGGIDCSRDPKAAQHLMGIVPDESILWPELTAFENLAFCGALYALPLTYGADLLHGAVNRTAVMPVWLDLAALTVFCLLLFLISLRNIRRKWIA